MNTTISSVFDGRKKTRYLELRINGLPDKINFKSISKFNRGIGDITADVTVQTEIPKDRQMEVGSYLSRLLGYKQITIIYPAEN